jgi:NADH:ubiquinone oxidoreductase subunit K
MLRASHKTLKILAALLWYIGVYMLLTKGWELAQDAQALEPQKWGQVISWGAGIIVGIIKTRLIFIKSCKKNMARIDALDSPKIWQFYRYQFFIALIMMIVFGSYLSRVSQGNYPFLLAVSILDISIGTALLLSSYVFYVWKQR